MWTCRARGPRSDCSLAWWTGWLPSSRSWAGTWRQTTPSHRARGTRGAVGFRPVPKANCWRLSIASPGSQVCARRNRHAVVVAGVRQWSHASARRRPAACRSAHSVSADEIGVAAGPIFRQPSAPDLAVVATVCTGCTKNLSVRWRIAVRETGPLRCACLHYPRLPGIAQQEREVLAVPVWMGEKTDQPRQLLNRHSRRRSV